MLFWDDSHGAKSPVSPFPVAPLYGNIFLNWMVVATTAATGLAVANILRKKDNLVKVVGTSASIITIIAAQFILFPELRQKTFNAQTVAGAGIISISTWIYHYKKSLPEPLQISGLEDPIVTQGLLENVENGKEDTENKLLAPVPSITSVAQTYSSNSIRPTAQSIKWAVGCVAILSAGALFHDYSDQKWTSKGAWSNRIPLVDDVQRYFAPKELTPAVWGKTQSNPHCIEGWTRREKLHTGSLKLQEWESLFPTSSCPVYPIPREGMFFHQYWTGPWRAFNEISIEAFLGTQRLGDGHRLIYWYENGGPPEDVRARWTGNERGQYVLFRELDRTEEAKGYCVENMPEWNDRNVNLPYTAKSDLVRNFLLAKYGGIWLGADTIPLRDLTPVIRSGPVAPSVSSPILLRSVGHFDPIVALRRCLDKSPRCVWSGRFWSWHQDAGDFLFTAL
jgi:hypothetical protein